VPNPKAGFGWFTLSTSGCGRSVADLALGLSAIAGPIRWLRCRSMRRGVGSRVWSGTSWRAGWFKDLGACHRSAANVVDGNRKTFESLGQYCGASGLTAPAEVAFRCCARGIRRIRMKRCARIRVRLRMFSKEIEEGCG
jgi:hypothetical protein